MPGAGPVTILDYPTPHTDRVAWGPFLFRPSRTTLLLALLTIAAATWLTLHHDPWRLVTRFDVADQAIRFTTSGNLRSLGNDSAHVYDPRTGRLLHSFHFGPLLNGDHLAEGGDQIVIARPYSAIATLLDLRTGATRELPLPVTPGAVRAVAADPPRVIASTVDGRLFDELHYLLPGPTTLPTRLGADTGSIGFSPDGRSIVTFDTPSDTLDATKFTLLDALTGRAIVGPLIPRQPLLPISYFAPPHWLVIPTANSVDVYSTTTGRRERSTTAPVFATFPGKWIPSVTVSGDAQLIAYITGPTPVTLEVVDLTTGRRSASRPVSWPGRSEFIPGSHHLLVKLPSPGDGKWQIIDPTIAQPLAILPDGAAGAAIRPDGQAIAIAYGGQTSLQVATLVPAGPDCPESQFGALAFPQTWLTALLFTALIISLARDARRVRAIDTQPVNSLLALGFLAIATMRCLLYLLGVCLRHDLQPPLIPITLVAAIGLLTYARIWRLTALVILAINLPSGALELHRAHAIARQGNPYLWTPLDRTYALPPTTLVNALAAAIVLTTLALILLALRPRPIAR